MINSIQKIDDLKAQLAQALPMPREAQLKLDKKFRLEFNYTSNHMEGNTLTYGETELLLILGNTQGNHTLQELEEMRGHDVAFKLVQEWATQYERPLTELDIKNLHKVFLVRPYWKNALTSDGQPTRREIDIGNYKLFPNSVRLENGEIFEYASVTDTPILMGELMQWLRKAEQADEMHPVYLAALLHYKLVRIHPFDDGNGRISRLVMNYVLLKNHLPPVIIKSTDKRNYLFALNQADIGNEAAFVEYIAQQLIWSLEISLKAARGESIEDPDDIDKEINIWKKQVSQNDKKPFQRSNSLVSELYQSTIRDLFRQFEEKHRQFYDLFYSSHFTEFKNNGGRVQREWWLDDEINRSISEIANAPKDDYQSLSIIIYFNEYKFGNKNAGPTQFQLRFEFYPSAYLIHYGEKIIEKKYDDFLNTDDKKNILSECLKYAFATIKARYAI